MFIIKISHMAVLIKYRCSMCEKEFRVTYDITQERKRCRHGYFSLTLCNIHRYKLYMPYSEVEIIFRCMWHNYHFLAHNCKHWANEFYDRVEEKYCTDYGGEHEYRCVVM